MALVCLCKAILHPQRSAEATVTARVTGQAIFKCPEPVPARAATSQVHSEVPFRVCGELACHQNYCASCPA
eukprot:120810-Pleurochrysis_carterae.AAC.1